MDTSTCHTPREVRCSVAAPQTLKNTTTTTRRYLTRPFSVQTRPGQSLGCVSNNVANFYHDRLMAWFLQSRRYGVVCGYS